MNTGNIEGGTEEFGTPSGSLIIENTKQRVSLIVSHNSRLRCLLKNYNSIAIEPKHSAIYRLMNCAILKLELFRIPQFRDLQMFQFIITLEYDGEIGDDEDKKDNVYYTKTNTNTNIQDEAKSEKYKKKYFTPLEGTIIPKQIAKIGLDKEIFDNLIKNPDIKYVFYMVRHGQGTHNIHTGLMKKLTTPDTNLTDEGERQAVAAGRHLREIIDKKHSTLTSNYLLQLQSIKDQSEPDQYLHLFVSDLRRTHQTMVNLIRGIKEGPIDENKQQQSQNQITKIPEQPKAIVLPCSHELDFKKEDGICDANQPYRQKLTGENRTCCITYDSKKAEYPTNPACGWKSGEDAKCYKLDLAGFPQSDSNKLNIIWDYYLTFYKNNISDRAFRYFKSTGPNCSNTSMIAHAIAIINNKTLHYVKTEIPLKPRKTLRSRLSTIFTRKQTQKTPNLEKSAYSGHGFVGNYVNMLLNLK